MVVSFKINLGLVFFVVFSRFSRHDTFFQQLNADLKLKYQY